MNSTHFKAEIEMVKYFFYQIKLSFIIIIQQEIYLDTPRLTTNVLTVHILSYL